MLTNVVTLRDPAGLHARLAAQIAETAKTPTRTTASS